MKKEHRALIFTPAAFVAFLIGNAIGHHAGVLEGRKAPCWAHDQGEQRWPGTPEKKGLFDDLIPKKPQ